MFIADILRAILPRSLKLSIRKKINQKIREFKAPKMIWGYEDCTGAWRIGTRISDTVFIYHPERIKISDNVFIWHYTILDGTGGIEIGEGCQIGAWVGIFTHSSHIAIRIYGRHYRGIPENEKQGYPIAPVKIGKYVFIAAGSTILPGVTIGDGVLVTAGSIVTKSVEDFSIVTGNPAEVVGDTRRLDKRYLRDAQLKEWYEEWQNDEQAKNSSDIK